MQEPRLLTVSPKHVEIALVITLVEQCFFLVRKFTVVETVNQLVRPMGSDRDFDETECLQQM